MSWLLRTFIKTLIGWWLKRQRSQALQQVKLEGVKTYLKVLQGVRQSALGVIGFLVVLQLMSFGLALMLGAGVFLSPLEIETKLWIVVGLGALLFFVPVIALMIVFSERLWYRISGADKMVENLLKYDSAS